MFGRPHSFLIDRCRPSLWPLVRHVRSLPPVPILRVFRPYHLFYGLLLVWPVTKDFALHPDDDSDDMEERMRPES